jgi:hypothetical protein
MQHALADIRFEEDYARFYAEYMGQQSGSRPVLPPPLNSQGILDLLAERVNNSGATVEQHQQQQQQQALTLAAAAAAAAAAVANPGCISRASGVPGGDWRVA